MNIITIDPSLTCTAVIINDRKHVFASYDTAYSKTGKLVKWFDEVDPLIRLHTHKFDKTKGTHAASELKKLCAYEEIVHKIVKVIEAEIPSDPNETTVYIEGYSYSSAAGPLIDLVTFGTILRHRIHCNITDKIHIVPPSELKMYAAKFTYPSTTGKANEIIRNNDGVSGGKFKKPEMYKALVENQSLNCPWVQMLRKNAPALLLKKAIPKPIEDLNDAKLMYEIAKTNKYF